MTAYIAELDACSHPWRWELAFDYSADMVDAIKAQIPSRQRKWIPARKVWWFQAGQLASIEALGRMHCGSVIYLAERTDSDVQMVPAEQAAAYRTLHLLPSAPDELVKAAYRILAKRLHPDAGGSTDGMQHVNAAYSLLSARSRGKG